jgi:5-methylcytosine-specific restriction endonuclease McrA
MRRWYTPGLTFLDSIYRPDKASRLRRRQLENDAGTGFTDDEFEAVKKRYDHRCVCCEKKNARLVADHVKSLHCGGAHHISNIQPLCAKCNFKKGL